MSENLDDLSDRVVWFDTPAAHFNEALPIGNGRLGAMVYGSAGTEVLPINEDCFWAGRAAPAPSPTGPSDLARVRELLLSGDRAAAEAHVVAHLLTGFNQPYLPAADLTIDWGGEPSVGYRRWLDLASAVAGVDLAEPNGGTTSRRYSASAPDQVIVISVRNNSGPVMLTLSSKLRHVMRVDEAQISVIADAPDNVVWSGVDLDLRDGEGITYDDIPPRQCHTSVRVILADGAISTTDEGLVIDAENFEILITAATSGAFADPTKECDQRLAAAVEIGAEALTRRGVASHRSLFGRVRLQLGDGARHLPTNERLSRHAAGGPDADLEGLIFDYGRYLLISSSRPGTQAANLQGIWNDLVQPPWWCNYTLNINLEMNYWPAETCNLAECHIPLFDLIDDLVEQGKNTARVHYGMDGWVAHHQTDFLRQTTPVGMLAGGPAHGPAQYAMWPMAGAWLCQHLWRHFEFGGERAFLRDRAWPVMRGAARFLLHWIVEGPDGLLTTAPSTSPENRFLTASGQRLAVCMGSAMDLSLLRDHFRNCLLAAHELGINDDPIVDAIRAAVEQLAPLQIGSQGQIMEWDEDYAEGEHPHRHISQLFGLFPGREIDRHTTPALAAAAVRTLELRGPSGTGWSLAWKAALWARLGAADNAYDALDRLIHPISSDIVETANDGGGIYPNLLMACPPFQIDANLGYTAAVAEMLLQSSGADIALLPALPARWEDGEVVGLRVVGQVTVGLAWRNGRPKQVSLISAIDQHRIVRFGNTQISVSLIAGEEMLLTFGDDGLVVHSDREDRHEPTPFAAAI